MPRALITGVIFEYDENDTAIHLEYDGEANEVVLRLNRNGLAQFADICETFANISPITKRPVYQDEHWQRLGTSRYALTLIVNNRLPDTELGADESCGT